MCVLSLLQLFLQLFIGCVLAIVLLQDSRDILFYLLQLRSKRLILRLYTFKVWLRFCISIRDVLAFCFNRLSELLFSFKHHQSVLNKCFFLLHFLLLQFQFLLVAFLNLLEFLVIKLSHVNQLLLGRLVT